MILPQSESAALEAEVVELRDALSSEAAARRSAEAALAAAVRHADNLAQQLEAQTNATAAMQAQVALGAAQRDELRGVHAAFVRSVQRGLAELTARETAAAQVRLHIWCTKIVGQLSSYFYLFHTCISNVNHRRNVPCKKQHTSMQPHTML